MPKLTQTIHPIGAALLKWVLEADSGVRFFESAPGNESASWRCVMQDKIDELLTAYDEKRISRRQLIGALLMASATPLARRSTETCGESYRHAAAE